MVVEQKYDYSNKILDFGFYYKKEAISNNLSQLIDSVKENIIICDTQGIAIEKFLSEAAPILNSTKTVIGLVNDKSLALLKKQGVNSGFFRSTNAKINLAVLIVDKTNYFVSPNGEIWLELKNKKSYDEIFQYINHLIWTNTLSEFFQGEYKEVRESRLSVIKPVFKNASTKPNEAILSTEDINSSELLLEIEKHTDKKSYLLNSQIPSAYIENKALYIDLFDGNYYPVVGFEKLIKGESFTNARYSTYVDEEIWYNNKKATIIKTDMITKNIELPLDQYKSYKPDFAAEEKKYSGFTTSLVVRFDVNPMKKTNAYQKHINYKNYAELEGKLNVNLEKLVKLAGDEKKLVKQLEAISSSRTITEKVEKYNKYIKETKIGDETLTSKKKGFKEISFKEEDIIVPSDLLGELLTKDKKSYFAVVSEDMLDAATKWLKENKIEAVLILE